MFSSRAIVPKQRLSSFLAERRGGAGAGGSRGQQHDPAAADSQNCLRVSFSRDIERSGRGRSRSPSRGRSPAPTGEPPSGSGGELSVVMGACQAVRPRNHRAELGFAPPMR